MDEKTARKYRRLGRLPSEVAPERTWRTREDPFAEVWPEVHEQLRRGSRPGGQDAVCVASNEVSGEVRRLAVAELSAWGEALASDGGSGEGGVLQPGASSGAVVCVGFHPHEEPGRDDRRPAVRPPGLPLRADVLELGVDHDLFFGELREPQRRASKRRVGIGRRAPAAPHGSDEPGGEQRLERRRSSPSGTRGCWATTGWRWRRSSPRSRTRTATSSSRTGGSRRRWSRRCCCVAAGTSRAVKPTSDSCRSWWQLGMRAVGSGWPRSCLVLRRLPDRRRESYKRLSVRVDAGSLIHVDRNTYSVPSRLIGEKVEVRLYVEHVEVWYAQQEVERLPRLRGRKKHRDQLPAHHRLAGAEAGGFRELPLPGRAVSHEPLSHGLRRLAGSAAGAWPQGVSGDSLPGGTPERDGGGRGVANASGQRPARELGRRSRRWSTEPRKFRRSPT